MRSLGFVLGVMVAAACFAQTRDQVNLLNDVKIEQRLGQALPLDAKFRDEMGREVALSDYFNKGKPVVLSLIYYRCPSLCNQILNGMLASFRVVKHNIGQEYDVVCISIDPRETPELAAQKKESYVKSYGRPGAGNGWHFLTGAEEQIRRVADAVGYHYKYVPETDLYAHAAGIVVCTPGGRLGQYFYGIEYSPRQLELALAESSNGKVGDLVDAITLWCTVYDPATGSYQFMILRVIQVFGILTVIVLATFIVRSLRSERRPTTSASSRTHQNGTVGGDEE